MPWISNKMPKFKCKCGHIINLSNSTNEAEFSFVPEINILEIAEILANISKMTDDQFFNLIDRSKQAVYKCPACRRLHVETGVNQFDTYMLESAKNENKNT